MDAFTIKDIENLSGVKAHTIRIWEQRYNFLKPRRTQTNIRYYSNEELKAILDVALLKRNGYKISQVSRMDEEEINDKISRLSNLQALRDLTLNRLIGFMIDLQPVNFEALLNDKISAAGITAAIGETIFPFLEKTGLLWQPNAIHPAQESLVTHIIRQKLLVAIDDLKVQGTGKKAVLFLPEGLYAELGLIYVNYLFRSRGIHVYYLGADVPADDLIAVVNDKLPDFVFTHLSSSTARFNFEQFMNKVEGKIKTFYVLSQPGGSVSKKALPGNIFIQHSFEELKEFVEGL